MAQDRSPLDPPPDILVQGSWVLMFGGMYAIGVVIFLLYRLDEMPEARREITEVWQVALAVSAGLILSAGAAMFGLEYPAYRRARIAALTKTGDDGWQPTLEARRFDGQPLTDAFDFFHRPPKRIGPVIVAHSTLPKGKLPSHSALARGWIWSAIGIPVCVVNCIVFFLMPSEYGWGPAVSGPLAAIGGFLANRWTAFDHVCMYVGRDGMARCRCVEDRWTVPTRVWLGWSEATILTTQQTQIMTTVLVLLPVYSSTEYNYEWLDGEGQSVLQMKVNEYNKHDRPGKRSLARQWLVWAEQSWTNYLLANPSPDACETFPLLRGGLLRIWPDRLILDVKGELVSTTFHQIRKYARVDHKLVFRIGRQTIQFSVNRLCNALYFDTLLTERIRTMTRVANETEEA